MNNKEHSVNRIQQALEGLVHRIDSPSPVVLSDVMQENIDRMQAFADAQHLEVRPHVKTHKCVEIGRRQVKAGAVGITAGNVGEAEVFAAAGFGNIFIAYPIWTAGSKGPRIRKLAETTHLRVGVDNVAAIDALADAMGSEAELLQVVIEGTAVHAVPVLLPRPSATSPKPPASAALFRRESSPIRAMAAPIPRLANVPRLTRMLRWSLPCAASAQWGLPRKWSAPALHRPWSLPPTASSPRSGPASTCSTI